MNKISSTSIFALFVVAVLVVGGFVSYTRILVGVPGRYLTADLSAADLSGISSNLTLVWGALIIMIIFCLGYGIHYLINRKKISV